MKKLLFASVCILLIQPGIIHAQKNVIMYIGDGFGIAPKTAARMAMGQGTAGKKFSTDADFRILALDKLKNVATLTTHSQNSWITDSGPGASVYACGKAGKIDNEAIAYSVSGDSAITTILERAKKEGYAVGIVTTTRVTHATPASFASHIWFRDLEDYIASQFISSTQAQYQAIYDAPESTIKPYNPARDWNLPEPKKGVEVDVILGGGLRHFFPNGLNDTIKNKNGSPVVVGSTIITQAGKRTDKVNLIKLAADRGYAYVNSRDALLNIDLNQFTSTNTSKLIGLFNSSHMNYEQDRQTAASWEPSLFEMTQIAIEVLKRKGGSKGFFLLVEGGRIDHLSHANTGGIEVIAGTPSNQYNVQVDKETYVGGGDGNYAASPSTARQPNVYGSDYMIKEVLAFDYAVQQGRNLLNDPNSKTLIFSSSDHECGGTAVVGLHDEADAQANSTKIRTYALGPKQNGIAASSSGPATATTVASPTNITRGDIGSGAMSPEGWYPDYTTTTFQERPELWPQHTNTGRRIVISYGSNPITNGNGTKAGGTPGNHTPQDVWVGGEDNDGGKWAGQITGKGLLDNTDLTKVMADFLHIVTVGIQESDQHTSMLTVFPNPINNHSKIRLTMEKAATVKFDIYNQLGQLVSSTAAKSVTVGINEFSLDELSNQLTFKTGVYYLKCFIDGKAEIQKMIRIE